MHPNFALSQLVYRLLISEDGFTMGEVMWSLAAVALIVGVAVVGGSAISPEWREAVERVVPINR